jgi:hypothetical protein
MAYVVLRKFLAWRNTRSARHRRLQRKIAQPLKCAAPHIIIKHFAVRISSRWDALLPWTPHISAHRESIGWLRQGGYRAAEETANVHAQARAFCCSQTRRFRYSETCALRLHPNSSRCGGCRGIQARWPRRNGTLFCRAKTATFRPALSRRCNDIGNKSPLPVKSSARTSTRASDRAFPLQRAAPHHRSRAQLLPQNFRSRHRA